MSLRAGNLGAQTATVAASASGGPILLLAQENGRREGRSLRRREGLSTHSVNRVIGKTFGFAPAGGVAMQVLRRETETHAVVGITGWIVGFRGLSNGPVASSLTRERS